MNKTTTISLLMVSLASFSVHAAEPSGVPIADSDPVPRQLHSLNLTTLGFGPGALTGLGDNGLSYHLQGGLWREVHPNAAIRVLSEFDTRSGFEAWKVSAGLGAVWLPLKEAFSPFLGADLGWGFGDGEHTATGFALGASAGLQLFRGSSTQMSVEARSSFILDGDHLPWANSLALSVGF